MQLQLFVFFFLLTLGICFFFNFGSKAKTFFCSITRIAACLSSSYSSLFLHPRQLQLFPQYPFKLKHSQYIFKHLEFLQLQDLLFFFLLNKGASLTWYVFLWILCFLSELGKDSYVSSDLRVCPKTFSFFIVKVDRFLLSINSSGRKSSY